MPEIGKEIRNRLPDAEEAAEDRRPGTREKQNLDRGVRFLTDPVGEIDDESCALAAELQSVG